MNTETSGLKPDTTSCRKQKKFILIGLLLLSALVGGMYVFITEGSPIDTLSGYIFGMISLFLILGWCHYDALERGYKISNSMRICLVLLFGVAFPVYLFKSRGLGGFKALLLSALFVGTMFVTGILAAVPCYGIGCWLGVLE